MKECTLEYRPTFIYLHVCDSLQDIEDQNFEFYAESDANLSGTTEYEVYESNKSIFKYKIPLNHPEEEDLDINELEGKILVREINVYRKQQINVFIDEDSSLEPFSVYNGLAYNFDGIYIDSEEEELELQEYTPRENETEERYFEYFLIKNGKPEEIVI